jgi:hypothetical protein
MAVPSLPSSAYLKCPELAQSKISNYDYTDPSKIHIKASDEAILVGYFMR